VNSSPIKNTSLFINVIWLHIRDSQLQCVLDFFYKGQVLFESLSSPLDFSLFKGDSPFPHCRLLPGSLARPGTGLPNETEFLDHLHVLPSC
jgi:hypothetical protein